MKFTVFGIPIPQQRARVMRSGYTFDPLRCRQAKKLIAEIALGSRHASEDRFWRSDHAGRVSLHVRFFGARQNADLDNLYKLIADALQGVLYKNDSQIDHAEIWRHPANKGEERMEVEITAL